MSADKDRVTELQEMIAAVANLRICSEQMEEGLVVMAKLTRRYYDALINEGFGADAALQILLRLYPGSKEGR